MHAPAGSACVRPKIDGFVTLLLLLLLKGLTAGVAAKPVDEHMLNCICCCCIWLGGCAVVFAVAVELLLPCAAVTLPAAAAVALVLEATAPAASLLLVLLPGALHPAWHMPNRAHNAPGRCSSPGLFAVSAMICSHPGRICCSNVGSVPIAVDRQKPCRTSINTHDSSRFSVCLYDRTAAVVFLICSRMASSCLGALCCISNDLPAVRQDLLLQSWICAHRSGQAKTLQKINRAVMRQDLC
jgi:hypothetical protein